jgi:5S rRNA maturation endonuclease (ribonuclease M5)
MQQQNPYRSPENQLRYNTLAQLCVDKIEDLFDDLSVELEISGNKYVGICPIHGNSDNPAALNIYYDGYAVPGFWKCRTKSCQNKFGKNIIGFTRGCLSALKLGYHYKDNPLKVYGFNPTIDYLCRFLKVKLNNIKVNLKEYERRKFIAECQESCALQENVPDHFIKRELVRKNLIIPSEYFIGRGFDPRILDKYDIGLAKIPKAETANRVIVPIYNEKEYLVGYTCRSTFDRCSQCRLFHEPTLICPDAASSGLFTKWRHMNFDASRHLYNYWNAKPFMQKANTAILVEGPGDVWKLEQCGIQNSVAMFGHTLHDHHQTLLAKAQVMSIVVLTDSDDAGIEGAQEIKRKYGRLFRLYFPKVSSHDIGDMNEDAITSDIRPILNSVEQYLL